MPPPSPCKASPEAGWPGGLDSPGADIGTLDQSFWVPHGTIQIIQVHLGSCSTFQKKLKIKVLAPEDFGNFGNAAASMSAEYTPSWCVG